MATTQNTYTGNGSTTNYSFTFEYLKQSDVKVTLDTVATTAFTFANATTIAFTSAPASNVAIRIFRDTAIDLLSATFFPGSAIKAEDLNQNFTQSLYVTQESDADAASATTTANTAKTTADTALTNSAAAVVTANAADALATTSNTNSAAAVVTANASNVTAASAASDAASAVTTAGTALTNSAASVVTANAADANATTALNNSRESDGSGGFTTAISKANTALTTANSASTSATSATSTANTAATNATTALNVANAASASVADSAFYAPIADLANLPGSPANEDRVEVINSTGVESNANVSTVPSGFVGSSDLTVRLQYNSTSSKWVFQNYLASDPDGRYLTNVTPVVKGDGVGQVGQITLNCSDNSHGVVLKSPPHSASASYSLTLPTGLPTIVGQSLTSDLSGTLSFSTIDSGFITTKQTITISKTIDADTNAAMMGPTVAIASGTNITVGQNSILSILI